MKTILVPVDFSGATQAVIDAAIELRGKTTAKIVILHVIPPPVLTSGYGPMIENVPEVIAATERAAILQVDRIKADLKKRKISVEALHAVGMPASVIVDQAKKRKPAYIVLGSHGHTAVYDLFVGSTTHLVLKNSPSPVVVVPLNSRNQPKQRR